MTKCHECRKKITGETGILCAGICGKFFHSAKKCSGLEEEDIEIYGRYSRLKYICEECDEYLNNIDSALKAVKNSVECNNVVLKQYSNEFRDVIKQNETEICNLLTAIEKKYEERFNEFKSIQKNCEENASEVRKIRQVAEVFKSSTEHLGKENTSILKELKNELKKVSDKQSTAPVTFANVVKSVGNTIVKKSKEAPLIIKPKNAQNSVKTKTDLAKNIDPKKLKISNLAFKRNGTIVVDSENSIERQKIKNVIEEKIGSEYEIIVPKGPSPRIVIVGLSCTHTDSDLIDALKNQNSSLENSEIKIIKQYETKNKGNFNAIIETDYETYVNLLNEKKIKVGWDICKVFEGNTVLQCFKCKGYGHKATQCRNEETCSRCHGNHKTSDCKKEELVKCINCIRANSSFNLKLDVNHKTNDRLCPVYLKKLQEMKKRLNVCDP